MAFVSCKKDDLSMLSGEPSAIGAVGNEITFSHSLPGVGPISMSIASVNDGISTVDVEFVVTDPDLLAIANFVADLNPTTSSVNGDTVSVYGKMRFTTDGIATVFKNGDEMVICKYDASVGDKFTMNVNNRTVKHEVVQKSTEDDYPYAFWNIKVVTMEATNYGIPGVNKLQYISNHRFGPVGLKAYMTDGTEHLITLLSLFEND